jgi:hypothetical protein
VLLNNNKDEDEDEDDDSINKREMLLVCEILGNPIQSIHWLKDGHKIKDEIRSANVNLMNNVRLALIANDQRVTSNEIVIPLKKTVRIHTSRLNAHKFISKLFIRNYDIGENGLYQCIVNGNSGIVNETILINGIKKRLLLEIEQLLIIFLSF